MKQFIIRAPLRAPTTVYVHVPWCLRKCPYCDFNSHVAPAAPPFLAYRDALLHDLDFELRARPLVQAPVALFFGGGTPSLLPPRVVADLIAEIRGRTGLEDIAEVTFEANPGTLERGLFAEYAAAGVNRISLGAQSFDDKLLQGIGRIHSAAQTRQAVEELIAAGVGNFNLDLMYGLPGQDRHSALADLEQGIGCGPAHVSWYALTLEPGTVFYRRPPPLPPEEETAEMEDAGREKLAAAGYVRYEVSAYARDGIRCRHNENYWSYGDYLGLGPGAHGKRSAGGRIVRTARICSPARWLREAGTPRAVHVREVPALERPFEFLLNALRRVQGFAWPTFEARTGLSRKIIARPLAVAIAAGLLEPAADGMRPSVRGLCYLNDLQAMFLPSPRGCPTAETSGYAPPLN